MTIDLRRFHAWWNLEDRLRHHLPRDAFLEARKRLERPLRDYLWSRQGPTIAMDARSPTAWDAVDVLVTALRGILSPEEFNRVIAEIRGLREATLPPGPTPRIEEAVKQFVTALSDADLRLPFKVLAARYVDAGNPGKEKNVRENFMPRLVRSEREQRARS